jgi:hypothetical protein
MYERGGLQRHAYSDSKQSTGEGPLKRPGRVWKGLSIAVSGLQRWTLK